MLRHHRSDVLSNLLNFIIRICRIQIIENGAHLIQQSSAFLERLDGITKGGRGTLPVNRSYCTCLLCHTGFEGGDKMRFMDTVERRNLKGRSILLQKGI